MKLFVQNPYKFRNQFSAERELLSRFEIAGRNLGIQISGGFSDEECAEFAPDVVLATHPYVAKSQNALTLGCLWNPRLFMEAVAEFTPNTLSYDGFLYASPRIKEWASELTANSSRSYCESTLYPSAHRTKFEPPQRFEYPVYVGTNWDGERHGELLADLARAHCLRTYGPKSRWTKIRELGAYYGEIEFGTEALFKIYSKSRIGLCLHHPSHLIDGIPNMRIFEIIASCALPICDNHAFVKQAFGDSVLYVDMSATPQQIAEMVIGHVEWIHSHPRQAAEMVRSAHQIFSDKYCLEALLEKMIDELQLNDSVSRSKLAYHPVC